MAFGRKKPTAQPEGRRPQYGEGRAPVYAYRSMRDERGEKPRGTSQVIERSRGVFGLLLRRLTLLLCIMVLLFGLWLKTTPHVTIIKLDGTIQRSHDDYEAQIARLWAQDLGNHTKLTIRADRLSREIEQLFPELAAARVELPLIGQLPNVILTPGRPVLVLVTQKGAFYVDENGKTMVRSDQVEARDVGSLPTIRDDSGLVPEPGKPALPQVQMQTVVTLIRLAQAAHLELETVSLPAAPNEVDLTVKGTNYLVKFALDQDPKQGIGALLALRDKFSTDNITPGGYVDLRVPDKAFYR